LAVFAVTAANYQPGFFSLPQKSPHPGNVETEETAAMLAVAGCSWLFMTDLTHDSAPIL
jgi:hypothetical protein